jgi:hypothetical protein
MTSRSPGPGKRRRSREPAAKPAADENENENETSDAGTAGDAQGTSPPTTARRSRTGKPKADPKRRAAWSSLDYVLLAALVAALSVLGYQVHRNYFRTRTAAAAPPPASGNLGDRLVGLGDVLALGPDLLPRFDPPPERVRLLSPAQLTPDGSLDRLLSGRDDGAVADLLASRGISRVVVAAALANPSLIPKVNVRNRLALYKPSDRFHALYLSEAAGLYEVVPGGLVVSDEEGAELVRIVRGELSGGRLSAATAPGLAVEGDFEVGAQLQGLTPFQRTQEPTPGRRNARTYTQRIRTNLFASGRASTLAAAARLAGRNLARLYEARAARTDGPLPEAMARFTVEVEVFHDWTDLHTAVDPSTTEGGRRYRSFLWRAIELGLHGLAVDRDSDRYVFRLPSDAVYSRREEVEDLLRRVCLDRLRGDEALRAAAIETVGKPQTDDELSRVLYRMEDRIRVQRFRAHHFREMTPGGSDIRRLGRGVPPLPYTAENVSRPALRNAIHWATRWLVENVQPDGRFRYRYQPELDYYLSDSQIVEQYNEVRHGLATYALFMSHEQVPRPDLWDAAERTLRWILERTVFGPAWAAPDRRPRLPAWVSTAQPFGAPTRDGGTVTSTTWRCPHGDVREVPATMAYVRHLDNAKMGGVAAAVLAVAEKIERVPAGQREATLEAYRPFLEGYADFLLFMQHRSGPHEGDFDHYFVAPDHGHYARSTTIYPGEILFALSRIYRLTGDPRIPPAWDRSAIFWETWFDRESAIRLPDGTYEDRRRVDLVQFVPWISMACHDMFLAVREEDPAAAARYAEFGIRASQWVVREYMFDEERSFFPEYLGGYFKWEFELPAMHSMVYAEGTAAAFGLGKLTGDARTEEMRRATVMGCRFATQQIVVPGLDDHFMPAPERARGGVRFGINNADMRTDYSYHTLSALNQTVRYMADAELRP